MKTERFALSLTGLACGGGGATTVERSLRRVPGVRRATVDAWRERALVDVDVDLDSDVAFAERLVAAVTRVGYGVAERPRRLPVARTP